MAEYYEHMEAGINPMKVDNLLRYMMKTPENKTNYHYVELNKFQDIGFNSHNSSTSGRVILILTTHRPTSYNKLHNFQLYPPVEGSGKILALMRIKFPKMFETYRFLVKEIKYWRNIKNDNR